MIRTWQSEIGDFLEGHAKGLIRGVQRLEIGLEDALALKLNIKSAGDLPAAGLLDVYARLPAFSPWVARILTYGRRFHAGIKVTPEVLSRELYVYATGEDLSAILGDDHPITLAHGEHKALFLGIDDDRGLSLYFDADSRSFVEQVEQDARHPLSAGKLWAWQQIRYQGDRLIAGKEAFEITPLPLSLSLRLLSHYPFPHFRYLIPKRELKNGNFGRDKHTGRYAYYTTVS